MAAKDAGTRTALEVLEAIGAAYAGLQANARNETLGTRTIEDAVQDRIEQLEGNGVDDHGVIGDLRSLQENISTFVSRARNITKDDLKGIKSESTGGSVAPFAGEEEDAMAKLEDVADRIPDPEV